MGEVAFGEGRAPGKERWPFSELKRGKYFQCEDVSLHTAIRTAASRAQKRLNKKFTVRKMQVPDGPGVFKTVIRVFLK
jgi:hypothetical protein